MADKKITELTAATNHATGDLLLVVKDAAGTPTSRSATFGSVFANVASPVTVTNIATFRSNTSITSATATISANTSISGRLTVHEKVQTDAGATIIGNNGKIHANNTITAGTINVAMLQETPLANTAGRALIDTKIATTAADAKFALLSNGTHTGTTQVDLISLQDSKGLKLTKAGTPTNSNPATDSIAVGTIFYDDNFLYIAINSTTLKRVALSTF
jgi:hypothetical protein|tara:strand:- start:2558 stop:3208 length:651 start_codon:yes stop_codon:yes gene_type:complete